MELRHLRYFIRAAELMNFTKAADSLFVSQPTLSVQIHQLEEELGTELFARVGRNLRLTESGRVFLVRALQAVKELEEGSKEIDSLKGLLRGNLSVASLPLYGSRLTAIWAASFTEQHPDVHVRFKAAASEDIEAAIVAGTVDLGVSFLPATHPEINSRDLFEDELVLVASKKHPIAQSKTLKPEDFRSLRIILPSERMSATKILNRYFEELEFYPNVVMSFDDGHALIAMIKMTDFITFLPKRGVADDPDICTLSVPPPGAPLRAGALWTNLNPASAAFLQVMTDGAKLLTN